MNTNIEQFCTGKAERKQPKLTITFPFAVQQSGTHSVEVLSAPKDMCVLHGDAFDHLRNTLGEKTALEIEAKIDEEYNRLSIIHSLIISRT